MTRSARLPLLACAATLLAACAGERSAGRPADGAAAVGDAVGGTMIVTTGADADILFPPLILSVMGNQVSDLVFERLAEIGPELDPFGDAGFEGELARKWAWAADSLSIAFAIDPGARWHDGRPVTARDVRFSFDTYREPTLGAQELPLLEQIDSVTTPDSLTAVFWFRTRYPQQFFDAAFHMRILPEHVWGSVQPEAMRTHPAARAPVGSGRWRFARWEGGSVIELVADTAYRAGRPRLDRVMWTISPNYDASVVKLVAGEADFIEFLRPDKVREVAGKAGLALQRYPSLDEGHLQFNLHAPKSTTRPHPILADRELRRALVMAVDASRIVQNVFDTLAVVPSGPVTRALATWDSTLAPLPFDADGARRALDALGWRDANGDGVREKGGRALRFGILVPSSSAIRVQIATLLQEMYRQVGVRVDIEQVEMNQMLQRLPARDYDAVIMALRHDAGPGSIRQSWGSASARSESGSNYSGYASAAFDAQVDSGLRALDLGEARAHYRRAYQTLIDDAPAIWLYETVNYAGRAARIQPVGMRADAWWARLHDWTIPADQRIARDRVGVTASAR